MDYLHRELLGAIASSPPLYEPQLHIPADLLEPVQSPARARLEQLYTQAVAFERTVPAEAEFTVWLLRAGTSASFQVDEMRVSEPDMLIFIGRDADGNPARILLPEHQVGLMFKETKAVSRMPIGFVVQPG